jgi:hypothetical protein
VAFPEVTLYRFGSIGFGRIRAGEPANNPLHRTGESLGRAMSIPSAMSSRVGCFGAVVRQPVSREGWPVYSLQDITPLQFNLDDCIGCVKEDDSTNRKGSQVYSVFRANN